MTPAVALLDANVLYSAPLRDLLLQMSFDGLFQAHWTAEIEDEWKHSLLANRPELAAPFRNFRKLIIETHLPEEIALRVLDQVAIGHVLGFLADVHARRPPRQVWNLALPAFDDVEPLGRSRLATKPWPTGSLIPTNTIGMVRVACRNAATLGEERASITSGRVLTSSAA